MLRDNLRVFLSRIPPPSPIAEREYAQIRRRANVLSVTSSFIRNLMINYVPRLPVSAAQHFLKKLIFPRISIELSPAVPTPHGEQWRNQKWSTIQYNHRNMRNNIISKLSSLTMFILFSLSIKFFWESFFKVSSRCLFHLHHRRHLHHSQFLWHCRPSHDHQLMSLPRRTLLSCPPRLPLHLLGHLDISLHRQIHCH